MHVSSSVTSFNEEQWIKLVFLLADTQTWIDEMNKELFTSLPVTNQKKYLRKTYYLTPAALAHIIERHYYKINRHPSTGKFHIPIPCILQLIRDAADSPTTPVSGSLNQQRTLCSSTNIGFNKNGHPENKITIITCPGGKIITAFPGTLDNPSPNSSLVSHNNSPMELQNNPYP
jgi:hypothetical protein